MTSIRVGRWPAAFDSLGNENYRWLWLGKLASSASFQMNSVAQGWLVYELTSSAFALGWVSAGWSITTFVLSLYAGVLCDRMEKRDLLIWARAGLALNYLVLAVLITTDAIQLWHLAASSLFSGVLYAFMMPAQQALLAELVDHDALLNAISLNSIGVGLMGIFAAATAGFVIERVGVEGVYLAMAALYLWGLFTLTKLPATGHCNSETSSVWAGLWEGLRYLGKRPIIGSLLALLLARMLFGMSYRTLMPKYASDVLGFEATGLGILMAAPGAGSLIASLGVASLRDFRGKGKLLLVSGVGLGLFLIFFANVHNFALVLVFLALVGATSNICIVANQTLLQANCEDEFRGRVTSMYVMTMGLSPLGGVPAGALADHQGVTAVISLQGGLMALVFSAILLLKPRIRKLE